MLWGSFLFCSAWALRLNPRTNSLTFALPIGQGDGSRMPRFEPSDLFDWPRTSDEDVHESPGALPPVRTGRHVGDADQRSKQIEWLQISTDVAALDSPLHQRINRSLNLTA